MKDLFSKQSVQYALYRPKYPKELYRKIFDLVSYKTLAWDCATGNGQAAVELACEFKQVIATDISEKQINQAILVSNVIYKKIAAEKTDFEDSSVDLITVAQALHWFHFDLFFQECKRVLKSNGILAVWSYNLTQISPEVDNLVLDFYQNILGSYWDPERVHVEKNYSTIVFPFTELSIEPVYMKMNWNLDQFLGYLGTWSALQKYIEKNKTNPLAEFSVQLKKVWGEQQERVISWPLTVRIFRV